MRSQILHICPQIFIYSHDTRRNRFENYRLVPSLPLSRRHYEETFKAIGRGDISKLRIEQFCPDGLSTFDPEFLSNALIRLHCCQLEVRHLSDLHLEALFRKIATTAGNNASCGSFCAAEVCGDSQKDSGRGGSAFGPANSPTAATSTRIVPGVERIASPVHEKTL